MTTKRLCGQIIICVSALTVSGCATTRVYSTPSQHKSSQQLNKSASASLKRSPLDPANGRLFLVNTNGAITRSIDAPSLAAAANLASAQKFRCDTEAGALFVYPERTPSPAIWQSCEQITDFSKRAQLDELLLRTIQANLYLDALYEAQGRAIKSIQDHDQERVRQNQGTLAALKSLIDQTEADRKDISRKLEELKSAVGAIK